MGVFNWTGATSSTKSSYNANNYGGTYEGTMANCYDTNFSTYLGNHRYRGGSGDWGITGTTTFEAIFLVPQNINTLSYKGFVSCDGNGEYGNGAWQAYVEMATGGAYFTIVSTSGGNHGEWNIGTVVSTTGWTGVTKVRMRLYSSAGGDRDGQITIELYELDAWGSAYQDVGFRVYSGTAAIAIGAEPLDATAHKVRYFSGTTAYGIPVVSTTSPKASAVHFFDGTGVMALPLTDST